ncbi:bestrophin family ion channel [Novosphingobium sp. MBES04]|nr:bestrophin family ion channel [Novosphingobium sp. MBES04]GAM04902.1 hypothetical protein MBENS4_1900 [Novosphingobium sp. MBES04]
MIVRNTPSFRDVLIATRGSILPQILRPLLVVLAASAIAC